MTNKYMKLLRFPKQVNVRGVAVGKEHSLAWDHIGILYGWGSGRDGKLGINITKLNKVNLK